MSNLPATISPRETKPDKIVFVFNFFDELRRLAPGGKVRRGGTLGKIARQS